MKKRILALLLSAVLLCADGGTAFAQAEWGRDGRQDVSERTGYFGVRQIALDEDDTEAFAPACGVKEAAARESSHWDIYASNYYYNMLEGAQREFYESLDAVCYEYLTTEKNAANNLMSGVPNGGLTEEERGKVYTMFRFSNPQYYFLTSAFRYDSAGTVYPVIYPAFAGGEERSRATGEFQTEIQKALTEIGLREDTGALERAIHDWILDRAVYDTQYAKLDESEIWSYETGGGFTQSSYSVFVKPEHTTLCAGYTLAFNLLCRAAGIDALAVTSADHAWNWVRLDGCWYQVDCTWDDADDGGHYYDYFNRSSQQISLTDRNDSHVWEAYYGDFMDWSDCGWDSGATHETPGEIYDAKGAADVPLADWEIVGKKVKVTLSSPNADAKIYYTTDGTTPSVAATKSRYYRDTFTVERGTAVKAVAAVNGYTDSRELVISEYGYEVYFDLQDGRIETQYVDIGKRLECPADPERDGYDFSGWFLESTCETEWDFENGIPSEGLTLYAKWAPKVYLNNGDMDTTEKEVTHGSLFGKLPVPQKYGYVFIGWYTEPAGGRLVTENSLVTQTTNFILYAQWKTATCNVVFESGNGDPVRKVELIPGETLEEPKEPTRKGYHFGGWYLEPECETKWDFADAVGRENMTLYAGWIPNTYRAIFVPAGGSLQTAEKEITYTKAFGELPTPERRGYTFLGWYTLPSGGEKVTEDTCLTVMEDVTLYAQWTERICGVTFEKQNGEAPSAASVRFGEKITAPMEPRLPGYCFDGWYLEEACETKWDFEDALEQESLILYAGWTPGKYRVLFQTGGGSCGVKEKEVTFGGEFGELPIPQRAAYAFLGWYTLPSGGEKVTEHTAITQTENFNVYARWIPHTYRVAYYLNGGENDKRNPLSYNITSADSTFYAPARSGYVFEGWYRDAACREKIKGIAQGTSGNLSVYAKWEKLTVKRASVAKLSSKRAGKITVKIKKVSKAEGYEIRYSVKSNLKNAKTRTSLKGSKTISGLKKGKRYYVQVRAYKKDSKGERIYGKWSKKKRVKVLK